jgi:hypothetical protein
VFRSIILIGPSLAGKTTLSRLLGERLNLPVVDLDDLRWGYYAEIGYDRDYGNALRQREGFPTLVAYWKPFDIHAVERVLSDYPFGHVIAFGAGHSVYDDDALFARAKRALAPHPYVVLVLPSSDHEKSVQVLRARVAALGFDPDGDIMAMNSGFIQHHSNRDLATLTIYTDGQTPEQMCTKLIAELKEAGLMV